jgi:hypothetical protein
MKQLTSIIQFFSVLFIMIGFFSACSPHIARNIQKSYPSLEYSVDIKVIKINETITFSYEKLGTITLGDAGLTGKSRCTYEALLELAKEEARKVGGNAIKITESIPPGWQKGAPTQPSTSIGVGVSYQLCHTLSVQILKIVGNND